MNINISHNASTYRTPWGPLEKQLVPRFVVLSFVLFIIISAYWCLRSLKDPLFSHLVGITYQPTAKIVSMLCIFPLLLFYSKLIDWLPKQKVFYFFASLYTLLFLAISLFTDLGPNTSMIDSVLGWVSYVAIESFGSIMVTLFWGFTTGQASADEGKKFFPMILSIAQIGAFIGPTVVTFSDKVGINTILGGTALWIIAIPFLIHYHKIKFHTLETNDLTKEEKKSGALEGLRIIIANPYVIGILGITTLHEVVSTILDYQMKFLASQAYPNPNDFAVFMGQFGQVVNIGTCLWVLLGSSYLLRKFGLTACLVLYPLVVLGICLSLYANPTLWSFFGCMALFKVLNYALNNPAKEVLYTPTSADVRYKAKSWIDGFGARSAKATGSLVDRKSVV